MKRSLLLLVLCAACGRAPRTHEVAIRNFRFDPDTLVVEAGDTVRFHNYDFAPHTATAGGSFDSSSIPADSAWAFVPAAGTFAYICSLHPNMKGVLTVR